MATSSQGPRYIAVSYVWEAAPWEDSRSGACWIRSTDGKGIRPAEVRNCVLERTVKYAESQSASAFWIDRECIDQRASAPTRQIALSAMDLVYRRSQCLIALLSIRIWSRIWSRPELCLLSILLKFDLVKLNEAECSLRLKGSLRLNKA